MIYVIYFLVICVQLGLLIIWYLFLDETNGNDIDGSDSLFLDLSTLRIATANFNEFNKIGEGGFGTVYKVREFSFFSFNYPHFYDKFDLLSDP